MLIVLNSVIVNITIRHVVLLLVMEHATPIKKNPYLSANDSHITLMTVTKLLITLT
jgi:hypothetical protein